MKVDRISYDLRKGIYELKVNKEKRTIPIDSVLGHRDYTGHLVRLYHGTDGPGTDAKLTYLSSTGLALYYHDSGSGVGVGYISKTIDGVLYPVIKAEDLPRLKKIPEFAKFVEHCSKKNVSKMRFNTVVIDYFNDDPGSLYEQKLYDAIWAEEPKKAGGR